VRRLTIDRDARSRAIAAVLWALLWFAVATVVLMMWHPWVIGSQAGCPAGQRTGWDGHCRTGESHAAQERGTAHTGMPGRDIERLAAAKNKQ
jgi:hypothetical protein